MGIIPLQDFILMPSYFLLEHNDSNDSNNIIHIKKKNMDTSRIVLRKKLCKKRRNNIDYRYLKWRE